MSANQEPFELIICEAEKTEELKTIVYELLQKLNLQPHHHGEDHGEG
jgi:hypothetical protein